MNSLENMDDEGFKRRLKEAGSFENFAKSLQAGVGKEYVYMSDLASKDKKDGGILQWVQLVMAGELTTIWHDCMHAKCFCACDAAD